MTSAQIRQSFLDFFKSKGHTIVPSASLLPDSPGLLFTNAGMNQFVPIFLNKRAADVDQWPGAIPGKATRAADSQKCIRAGGKHNDLEDVGLDTYHHTFFEMLGNWSFGDYFKKEAIDWGWELVSEVWKFPKQRLYATVYSPDKSKGDPSEFDQEAYDFWAAKFSAEGLDPKVHIVHGGKKDNFWMMGETGPCGPCSEIHIDLTPGGDTEGALVNKGDPRCIEFWNLVFIQFNANPDGSFSPLPAKHVDTGMGFERVTGILQTTRGCTDFTRPMSNYETDIFRPSFDKLEKLSGKKYGSTLPKPVSTGENEQEKADVAFRVIADHIRTLSFSIADGILPGNTDRNYVLRRILRRAVRYGRTLGIHEPFFYKLVEVLAETMGGVYPEIRTRKAHVAEVIKAEEEAFNKTLDRGLKLFEEYARQGEMAAKAGGVSQPQFSGDWAFTLYDTYGFPLDLTELMARERGMAVDTTQFQRLMDLQRAKGQAAQKKEVIAASNIDSSRPTRFVGFEQLSTAATVLDAVKMNEKLAVTLDVSPFYAEMGGQAGDSGAMQAGAKTWRIVNTQKTGGTFLHILEGQDAPEPGASVELRVDAPRRAAVQRHHTVTHLLHWALHEVVNREASQKGSYVGPDKLTFDFSGAALTPAQIDDVEKLVNDRILENAAVTATEVPYAQIKGRREIMQFFGEKYGDIVRVVQIGGATGKLDGYSMELCGGTHARATGEIGLFRIVGESGVAAGIRRIEAVGGLLSYDKAREQEKLILRMAEKINSPVAGLEKKLDALLARQKEFENQLKAVQQKEAAETARRILKGSSSASPVPGIPFIVENLGGAEGDFLQAVADALKSQFKGAVVLGASANEAVSLVASVSPEFTSKLPAGKIIQAIAPIVGGKGGGKPDNARGGGKDVTKLAAALDRAKELIAAAGN